MGVKTNQLRSALLDRSDQRGINENERDWTVKPLASCLDILNGFDNDPRELPCERIDQPVGDRAGRCHEQNNALRLKKPLELSARDHSSPTVSDVVRQVSHLAPSIVRATRWVGRTDRQSYRASARATTAQW